MEPDFEFLAVRQIGNNIWEGCSESEETHVLLTARSAINLLNALVSKQYQVNIKNGYNVQCPDCGHVESGFETEEEAAAWMCQECQLTLPGMESSD